MSMSMAVALRSHSDLVYLPDHGFVGEDGALRILIHVNRQIRRIDVSHNLLGSDGLTVLLQGLRTLRLRFSDDKNLWGIRELNLASNQLDDAAFEALLNYAKQDVCCEKVMVQGNRIQLKSNLDGILNALNGSNLTTLSLNGNPLDSSSFSSFISRLNAPRLSELHLSTCGIPPSSADAIVEYLSSPRSRNLESLEMNANELGARGVRRIVDVIEYKNFTIKQAGVFANDMGGSRGVGGVANEQDELTAPDGLTESEGDDAAQQRSEDQRRQDHSILDYNVSQRLPPLLERNRTLTRRIRRATLRALPVARILLCARKPNDQEMAKTIMRDVGERTNGSSSRFRLLDLPREVLYHIVRHASGDPMAFSEGQYVGLVKHVEEAKSAEKLSRAVKERVRRAKWEEDERAVWEVREEWLRRGGWDKWDVGVKPDKVGRVVEGDGEEDVMRGKWVKLSL